MVNPIIQVQTIVLVDGVALEGENEKTQFMFDVGASFFKGYLSFHLCVQIHLLGGKTMRVNLQM
jgi:hypothetical protein